MEKYRVDTDTVHATVVQTWLIAFKDDQRDIVVYDQGIALDKFGLPNAKEMVSQTIIRWDNGDRTYCGNMTVAAAVAERLRNGEPPSGDGADDLVRMKL